IVAESIHAAHDAADRVAVEYDVLPAVTDAEAALLPGAPRIHERYKTNRATRWERTHGDLEAAFQDAPVVVEAKLRNQRLMAVAMEPRTVAAKYDPKSEELTVWASTQTPHGLRDGLAQHLRMPPEKIHLIAPRVGGGFGAKIALYSEDVLVAWLARHLK